MFSMNKEYMDDGHSGSSMFTRKNLGLVNNLHLNLRNRLESMDDTDMTQFELQYHGFVGRHLPRPGIDHPNVNRFNFRDIY